MTRLRLAILISGRGSNMEAILDAAQDPAYPAKPVLVLSNRPDAKGLETAARAGIPTAAIDHTTFGKDREAFERAMQDQLKEADVEIIALAGFMRILSPSFVDQFAGRLMNIHPSLLPHYPGLDTHRRAIADGVREHGATVHFVTQDLDAGPVIIQGRVKICEDDSEHSLSMRVHEVEHRIYPEAVRWFASGRLRLQGDVALLDGQPLT